MRIACPPRRAQATTLSPLAVVHTLGNALTNISLGAVAVSFTHTIKALEPMFSGAPGAARAGRCCAAPRCVPAGRRDVWQSFLPQAEPLPRWGAPGVPACSWTRHAGPAFLDHCCHGAPDCRLAAALPWPPTPLQCCCLRCSWARSPRCLWWRPWCPSLVVWCWHPPLSCPSPGRASCRVGMGGGWGAGQRTKHAVHACRGHSAWDAPLLAYLAGFAIGLRAASL